MRNKVTIIGAGLVGGTSAYSIIASNVAEEVALIDIDKNLVRSQVMDLQHSVPFWGYAKVKEGTYTDIRDSRIVVVTCGVSQKTGETRLDLTKRNSKIIEGIVPRVFKANPNAVLLMVTNPVDVLTYQAVRMFPDKKNRIIGSGTILDSARFRFLLGEYLGVNPQSVHAYIVGEHGDSELALWSTATIGNTSIDNFKKMNAKEKERIFQGAKNAAYAIIEGKQATYYAIAAGVAQIADTVIHDKRRVLPVSHHFDGEYGIRDICLSSPVVLGRDGVAEKIDISGISADEKTLLRRSADKLKKVAKNLN